MLKMNDCFKNKRICVTGSTGLIGSNLVRRMLDNGAEVFAFGRSISKLQACFGDIAGKNNLHLNETKYQTDFLSSVGQLDYIFHAASPITTGEINEDPSGAVHANVDGILACINSITHMPKPSACRLVVFSSIAVYGVGVSDTERVVREDDTSLTSKLSESHSIYVESKRLVEALVNTYVNSYNLNAVILRISSAYGYCKFKQRNFFYSFLDSALKGQDIHVKDKYQPKRDEIYIEDLINAISVIADRGATGEAYNISSFKDNSNYCTVPDVAEAIVEACNLIYHKTLKVVYGNENDSNKGWVTMDNTKLVKLGWSPSYDLKKGVLETVKLYSLMNK